jgi:hypothetical protein
MTPETSILFAIFCASGLVVLLLLPVLAVWAWMMVDWVKRNQAEPEYAKPYTVQMFIGWPFGYYLNVYRKRGPAK